MKRTTFATAGIAALAFATLAAPAPAEAQYIKESKGTIRVQSYRGTKEDWLEKGKWIYRMEAPAKAGSMSFCMPLPRPGTYAIAVRHDINGNGSTDIFADGGAMSNNPSINLFNLGKPSYKKTAFEVGSGVESISIRMRYR
jgi:uncharacterized protein (DUF2141 family)